MNNYQQSVSLLYIFLFLGCTTIRAMDNKVTDHTFNGAYLLVEQYPSGEESGENSDRIAFTFDDDNGSTTQYSLCSLVWDNVPLPECTQLNKNIPKEYFYSPTFGFTVFHIAAIRGCTIENLDALFTLLKSVKVPDSIINAQTNNGLTALHCAAYHDNPNVLEWLLNHAANQTLRAENGILPIQIAASLNNPRCLEFLTNRIIGQIGDLDKNALLHFACGHVSIENVTYLLDNYKNHIDVNYRYKDKTPLDYLNETDNKNDEYVFEQIASALHEHSAKTTKQLKAE